MIAIPVKIQRLLVSIEQHVIMHRRFVSSIKIVSTEIVSQFLMNSRTEIEESVTKTLSVNKYPISVLQINVWIKCSYSKPWLQRGTKLGLNDLHIFRY